jgi:hypothetical protein
MPQDRSHPKNTKTTIDPAPQRSEAQDSAAVLEAVEMTRRLMEEKKRRNGLFRTGYLLPLVCMVLGLAAGFGYFLLRDQSSPKIELTDDQKTWLPPQQKVADRPVPFDLFGLYLKVRKIDSSIVKPGDHGEVRRVSAAMAMGFCDWLTLSFPPGEGWHYTLPGIEDLEKLEAGTGNIYPDTKEWSRSPNNAEEGVLLMRARDEKGTWVRLPVHRIETGDEFTFRIVLRKFRDSGK